MAEPVILNINSYFCFRDGDTALPGFNDGCLFFGFFATGLTIFVMNLSIACHSLCIRQNHLIPAVFFVIDILVVCVSEEESDNNQHQNRASLSTNATSVSVSVSQLKQRNMSLSSFVSPTHSSWT